MPESENLPNKPLAEAILEVKWGEPNQRDPAYPIMVGRLYDEVREQYPATEELPLAQFPPELAVHIPRHRFRAAEGGWPLVQIGPGIVTLNDTENYRWPDFRQRALELHPAVTKTHPTPDALDITSLKLQYIDAVSFDFEVADVRAFLKTKLHIDVSIPGPLFEGQPVGDRPADARVQLTFPANLPSGRVQLSVSTGRKNDRPAVIWHTLLWSVGQDAKAGWRDFERWLDAAHGILDHWFFALVQGDLLEEFRKQ